jgi:hypothetical protein
MPPGGKAPEEKKPQAKKKIRRDLLSVRPPGGI